MLVYQCNYWCAGGILTSKLCLIRSIFKIVLPFTPPTPMNHIRLCTHPQWIWSKISVITNHVKKSVSQAWLGSSLLTMLNGNISVWALVALVRHTFQQPVQWMQWVSREIFESESRAIEWNTSIRTLSNLLHAQPCVPLVPYIST